MNATSANRTPSVLAIDDDANILDIIKTYLEAEGFTVQAQTDPQQGVAWYEQRWRDVDLVLLDYIMPEMDGGKVFERVKQVNPNARVLLLTACDDVVAKKLFQEGLRGYIQKPFYLNQLVREIRDTIASP